LYFIGTDPTNYYRGAGIALVLIPTLCIVCTIAANKSEQKELAGLAELAASKDKPQVKNDNKEKGKGNRNK